MTTWDGLGNGVQTANPQTVGTIYTLPVNETYSIDLSQSWTNSSVEIKTIPKSAPVLNNEALWIDESGETAYAYNGGLSAALLNWYEASPPVNSLWQIKPSGGSGHWSQSYVSPSSNFTNVVRVTSAIQASGNNLGFALGGLQSDATGYNLFEYVGDNNFVPGMIMYNMSSQEWFNVSSKAYSYSQYATSGAAQFVPSFGPNGLLFVFGGLTGTPENKQYVQFDKAWMFDPISLQWASQQVTGDIPKETQNQCVVGAEGDDGTYEV